MPRGDVGRDGGVGQVAFVIVCDQPCVPGRTASGGLRGGAACRSRDMSVHVLRASISGLKATLLHARAYCEMPAGLDAFRSRARRARQRGRGAEAQNPGSVTKRGR
jgi:hypothetical protein